MIQFKEFQIEINHPGIPNKLTRKYDKNISVGMMKQFLKEEFYLNGLIEIEFQLPTGLILKDDKIIDKIYYPNLKAIIQQAQYSEDIQGVDSMRLKSILDQVSSRQKFIQVLSITNFTSLKLSDEFLMFRKSIIDYYYQNDPNRMEFAEINTQVENKNMKFMKFKEFMDFTTNLYPFSNQPFLQKALPQIFQIRWESIYKLVIIFTDSQWCEIFQSIRELYQMGFRLLFISFSDINLQWLQSMSNAYTVVNAVNCDFKDKELLKVIQGTVCQTLTQVLTPNKDTTYKIQTINTLFVAQSILKIKFCNDAILDEKGLITETMQYFIPKIENRQNLDKILKNKSQIKINLIQEKDREIKYSPRVFSKGSLKEVYECFINNQNYVLKQPLKSDGFKSEEDVISEIKNHLLAYEIFVAFYQQLYAKNEKIKVGFAEIYVLKNNSGKYFILEPKYNGDVLKFNSNGGFIRDEIDHFNQICQAFSVFSYIYSYENYMVLDLQGFLEGQYLTLSDPAVQTFRNDFSTTDLGKPSCDQFFAQWQNKQRIGSEYLQILKIL